MYWSFEAYTLYLFESYFQLNETGHQFGSQTCTTLLCDHGIEWAQQKGIFTQLYVLLKNQSKRQLQQGDQEGVLKSASIRAIQRNSRILSLLQTIDANFNTENQVIYPIKGCWLLREAYPVGYPRLTSDLDLCIVADQLAAAVRWTEQQGFTQDCQRSVFDRYIMTPLSHHIRPFRKDGISIEWHHTAIPELNLTSKINSKAPVSIEDHLEITAHHFLRHASRGDFQLKWLFDVRFLEYQLRKGPKTAEQDFTQKIQGPIASVIALLKQRDNIAAGSKVDENWWKTLHQLIQTYPSPGKRKILPPMLKMHEQCFWVLGALVPTKEYLLLTAESMNKSYLLLLLRRWIKLLRRLISIAF